MFDLPKLLQPGEAARLNKTAYDAVGCFFFLNTEDPPIFALRNSRDGSRLASDGGFMALVMALYNLYRDYGREFLEACLLQDMLPPCSDAEMEKRRRGARDHLYKIEQTFRPLLAHGTYKCQEKERGKFIDSFYDLMKSEFANPRFRPNNKSLTEYISSLDAGAWKAAARVVVRQSDEFFAFLKDWTNGWNAAPSEQKRKALDEFANIISDKGKSRQKQLFEQILRHQLYELKNQPPRKGGSSLGYEIGEKYDSKDRENGWRKFSAEQSRFGKDEKKFDDWQMIFVDAIKKKSESAPEKIYDLLESKIKSDLECVADALVPPRNSSLAIARSTPFGFPQNAGS